MKLTLDEIKTMDVCQRLLDDLQKNFGQEIEVAAMVNKLQESDEWLWEVWLLSRNLELAKEMLKASARINARYASAIDFALADYLRWSAGSIKLIRFLFENGARLKPDNSFICEAATKNKPEIIELLIKYGADVTVENNLPLRHAAARGDLETAKLLIAAGADVRAFNDSPVLWAAYFNHPEMIELLFEHGAVPTQTAQDAAKVKNNKEALQALQNYQKRP